MGKNQTYKKEIINGQEVMVLVEEVVVENEITPTPSIEELQTQIEDLQTQLQEVQARLDSIDNNG